MIGVAIMGFGIVGSGVAELLDKNHTSIASRAGEDIALHRILDLRDFPDSPYADLLTKKFSSILEDREIQVVVEAMGGLTPSFEYISACLEAGKSVVTSNKELVAEKGDELLALAKAKNLNFLFEASVGGGIPILRPIAQCLAANAITGIAGILNGTTNFILTKMKREQMSFDDALALAQSLGYAEHNPAADVDGIDSCRKICILASLAFGRHVYPRQVRTQGIREIKPEDVAYATEAGAAVKLIASAVPLPGGRLDMIVAPMLVRGESQLSTVDDVFNAILVRGDATGDVVFYGKGAGKMPTASAVVADVIDCVKHIAARKYLFWEPGCDGYVADSLDSAQRFFVRGVASFADTAQAAIRLSLGEIRTLRREGAVSGEIAFVTPEMTQRDLLAALERLADQFTPLSLFRVLDAE